MTYAFVQDVPADERIYREILELLPAEAPPGLIAHLAIEREGGLRYVDVWEDEAAWRRFQDEDLEPAVGEVLARYGLPHDHDLVHTDEVRVIDAWLGTPAAAASARPA